MLRKENENEILELFIHLPPIDRQLILWIVRWRAWLARYYELHWLNDTSRSLAHLGYMFLKAHIRKH